MSVCVLGMSEEFKKDGVAVNALWPQTGEYLDCTWAVPFCVLSTRIIID